MKGYKGVVILLVSVILISSLGQLFIQPDYKDSPDSRKREYYPALVVDKYISESCNKSRCENYYSVTVEIEGGFGYKVIRADKQAYDSAVIGHNISFPRHLTDPKVIVVNQIKLVMTLVGVGALIFLLFVFILAILFEDN